MFSCVGKLPGKVGIIDTTDGVIEWITDEDAMKCVNQGIQIKGYEGGKFKKVPCMLEHAKCNWAEGKNVFTCGSGMRVTADNKFEFKAGKKSYKGTFKPDGNGLVRMVFSTGINVLITDAMFEKLKG